jgi:hypothetical protein
VSDSNSTLGQAINNSTTRQKVIDQGLDYLESVGSDQLCSICITNGGSCCKGCSNLSNGIGCQLRNTSCTAWLCGFLRYLLYETDLIQEWNAFWKQVPGRYYREDKTPDNFVVRKTLTKPNIQFLSHELAEDLKVLSTKHVKQGYIIDLREKIDSSLDELFYWKSPDKQALIKSNLRSLSKEFYRFHQALENYRKETNSNRTNKSGITVEQID